MEKGAIYNYTVDDFKTFFAREKAGEVIPLIDWELLKTPSALIEKRKKNNDLLEAISNTFKDSFENAGCIVTVIDMSPYPQDIPIEKIAFVEDINKKATNYQYYSFLNDLKNFEMLFSDTMDLNEIILRGKQPSSDFISALHRYPATATHIYFECLFRPDVQNNIFYKSMRNYLEKELISTKIDDSGHHRRFPAMGLGEPEILITTIWNNFSLALNNKASLFQKNKKLLNLNHN